MDRKLRFIAGTAFASSYTMTLSTIHAHRRPAGMFGRGSVKGRKEGTGLNIEMG